MLVLTTRYLFLVRCKVDFFLIKKLCQLEFFLYLYKMILIEPEIFLE